MKAQLYLAGLRTARIDRNQCGLPLQSAPSFYGNRRCCAWVDSDF